MQLTQCDILLQYMQKNGSITGLESVMLGVMNYKGRIFDLRQAGHKIETVMETKANSYGEKKTYARYVLKDEDREVVANALPE